MHSNLNRQSRAARTGNRDRSEQYRAAARWALPVSLALALLISAGCAALVVGGAGKSSSYPATNRSSTQNAADDRISSAIRAEYRADSYLHSSGVSVTTYNGVVTLNGSVDSYQARSQAETLAAGVRGVSGVHNKIQVSSN